MRKYFFLNIVLLFWHPSLFQFLNDLFDIRSQKRIAFYVCLDRSRLDFLQRGADAVVMGVRFVGRDKVGDVPDDEQIAGRRVKEQDRVNPGVAAGDDEA